MGDVAPFGLDVQGRLSEEVCVARKSDDDRRGVCRVNEGLAPLEPKLVKNFIFMLRKPL